MSTHNLCFEQKYEKISDFLSKNFLFLEVKISIYLNRRVFVMCGCSLEVPHRGASNECPQHMFSSRNKKNIMWIPPLISSYEI